MQARQLGKKSGGKTEKEPGEQHLSEDIRRVYEHFGRLEILEGALAGAPFVDVDTLSNLAQQQLDSGDAKNASNLLHAAEHIAFAALAPKHTAKLTAHIPRKLKAAVAAELDRLTRSAEGLWSASENRPGRAVIENIYRNTFEQARTAFARGAYRPALQLARAAEELAHIRGGLPATLPGHGGLSRRIAS